MLLIDLITLPSTSLVTAVPHIALRKSLAVTLSRTCESISFHTNAVKPEVAWEVTLLLKIKRLRSIGTELRQYLDICMKPDLIDWIRLSLSVVSETMLQFILDPKYLASLTA